MKRDQTWIKIRQDLYKQVRFEVERRMGRNRSIEHYQLQYAKDFKRRWKISKPSDLIQSMKSSQVVLLADFHALYQSQKSHLRLLKLLTEGSTEKKMVGMECFYQEDQKHLDRFLEGKISEREFLKNIQWAKKWGFPWSHYRKIVIWAQLEGHRILALNNSEPQKGARALHQRDKWVATQVLDQLKKKSAHQIIVIYGDLHMARSHLPLELKNQYQKLFLKQIKLTRILQNSEKVYFQLSKRGLENQVDVVMFDKNDFCLNSVPPWVKWQNYLLYLEQNEDSDIHEEEGETDLNDYVGQYVEFMGKELGVSISRNKLSVFTAQESQLWTHLETKMNIQNLTTPSAKNALSFYADFIELQVSFYSPEAEFAYLSRNSVNHAATLAMHYLHTEFAKVKAWSFRGAEDFERLIWVLGMGYLGSKLINPKRKSDTLADIRMALSSKTPIEKGKEALRLALAQKMSELMFLTYRKKQKWTFIPKKRASFIVAAELLGGILGERLFNGYQQGLLSKTTLKSFLSKNWTESSFPEYYLEALETIESLPLAFESKKERL